MPAVVPVIAGDVTGFAGSVIANTGGLDEISLLRVAADVVVVSIDLVVDPGAFVVILSAVFDCRRGTEAVVNISGDTAAALPVDRGVVISGAVVVSVPVERFCATACAAHKITAPKVKIATTGHFRIVPIINW